MGCSLLPLGVLDGVGGVGGVRAVSIEWLFVATRASGIYMRSLCLPKFRVIPKMFIHQMSL